MTTLIKIGADVATGDILFEEAQSVAEEIKGLGRRSLAVKMDVSDYDQVKAAFKQIEEELGAVVQVLCGAKGTDF